MVRSVHTFLKKDLERKLVLLSGPRQVGKTTLSKSLGFSNVEYLSFDVSEDRLTVIKKKWSRKADLVIFDELHKMNKWKSWIKGVYDSEGVRPRLLVTGSARLDTYRKGGDSLAGRFFLYRLHPLSVSEVKELEPKESFRRLLEFGGFPEPFSEADPVSAARWRKSHLDRILKEDLLDLEEVRNLMGLETLTDLLADRVGSTISYRSIAEDLQVAPRTVQRWVWLLEKMFVIFVVLPHSRNIARAIQKEPKIYFFDTGRVKKEAGARLENVVASALYKRLHFLEDTRGENRELLYIRDRQKREVDFLTLKEMEPEWLVEVKQGEDSLSSSLLHFSKIFPKANCFQVVNELNRERIAQDIRVLTAESFLSQLES